MKDLNDKPLTRPMYTFDKEFFPWLPSDEKLIPFYWGVFEFVESHIDLSKIKKYSQPKEILDPCVGYVKLHSWEVAVLDTPLFQRLRKITQLGLAYHVYPTLRYSRLEHTIGVLGRLNQALQRLREKHEYSQNIENEKIDFDNILQSYETQVRLAALFHDSGHCIFSHLSESVLYELEGIKSETEYYPSTKEIVEIFNANFTSKNTNLSICEILSIVMLGVKKVASVLIKGNIDIHTKRNQTKVRTEDDLSDYMYQTARFIAGLPVHNDPRTVFLAQLISSGLDADKLDYMSREEHFSGIKIEMDLERIYNKIKLFHVSQENELPKELFKYSKHIESNGHHKDFIVLGIEKGGQFSYEEFCVARLALYEKIYLHKKVRAAEAFLKKKLEQLTQPIKDLRKVHNWLYLTESIIEKKAPFFTDKNIKSRAGELPFNYNLSEESIIDFTEIENRYIPFRAYGFGPANAKTDKSISTDKDFGGIEQNHLQLDSVRFWDTLNPSKKFKPDTESLIDDFIDLIVEEAFTILTKLKIQKNRKPESIISLFKELNLKRADGSIISLGTAEYNNPEKLEKNKDLILSAIKGSIIVDIPDYRRVQLKYDTLNFEEASYQTVRWTIPIDKIARYYQLHRILGYVYTDFALSPIINLACERVCYNFMKPKILVFDQTQVVPKSILNISEEIKSYIHECDKSFYETYQDLLTLHKELQTVSAKKKINDVMYNLNKLKYFETNSISYLEVEQFLKQFDSELQLSALNLISCIRVLPNGELESLIKDICKSVNPENKPDLIGILPLGSYMSSSSNMMKSYGSFLAQNNITQLNFTQNEKITQVQHIILVDDNINTGRQAANIIAKMLSIDPQKLEEAGIMLNKIHDASGEGERLNPEATKHFTNIKLTFIFITGYEDSDKMLKNYLTSACGLSPENIEVKIKHKLCENDKFFSGGSLSTKDSISIFREIKDNFKETPNKLTDLKKFLEKIGSQVVTQRSIVTEYKENPLSHCLGYCNRESLVIFPGSVPTMTMTALWCGGPLENGTQIWKPLIPRPTKEIN